MNVRNNIATLEEGTQLPRPRKGKAPAGSLEYGLITHLVLQQYGRDDRIDYDLLLSIPLTERIPALMTDFGKKRMHKLIVTLLREFCYAIPLPKTKKLNDTRISVCACDLMIAAGEDQLSLEDFILFFEGAKKGKFGPIKKALTHTLIINELLGAYRKARHDAYLRITERKEAELKALGPVERISPEPHPIKDLFEQSLIPLKKIS